jgi:hypothetical protein
MPYDEPHLRDGHEDYDDYHGPRGSDRPCHPDNRWY